MKTLAHLTWTTALLAVFGLQLAHAYTAKEPRVPLLRPVLPHELPRDAGLDARITFVPNESDFEGMQLAALELDMREACAKEEGRFFWSGKPEDTMRCWQRKGAEPALADSLIFEVDP